MFGAAAVGAALLLGSLVGGFLAYVGRDSDGARTAARRMLRFSLVACILAFFYAIARLLADLPPGANEHSPSAASRPARAPNRAASRPARAALSRCVRRAGATRGCVRLVLVPQQV